MSYKIVSWKPLIILLAVVAIIIGGIFGWKKYKNYKAGKEDTRSVYEALVQVVDQQASNPEEDKKASLKRGDVIAILPEGHTWTDTERTSYLIVKIKITPEEAEKLMEPVTKEVDPKASLSDGKDIEPEIETVRPRKYYLDVDVPTVNELMTKGQPYPEKVFGEGVIEER
ncbi:MAG TPA: hypothetical protein P5262_04585 [Candidatus Moranbacteria bacterium]|nr:hypothetical protein [Candidatus Moranbacteria bacterium]